jgi:hypothetical protein
VRANIGRHQVVLEEGIRMSEGELKKRLNIITLFKQTNHGDEPAISLDHIKQILDEAKEEYPLPQELIEEFCKEGDKPDLTDEDKEYILLLLRTNYNWFLKWFGDRADS